MLVSWPSGCTLFYYAQLTYTQPEKIKDPSVGRGPIKNQKPRMKRNPSGLRPIFIYSFI